MTQENVIVSENKSAASVSKGKRNNAKHLVHSVSLDIKSLQGCSYQECCALLKKQIDSALAQAIKCFGCKEEYKSKIELFSKAKEKLFLLIDGFDKYKMDKNNFEKDILDPISSYADKEVSKIRYRDKILIFCKCRDFMSSFADKKQSPQKGIILMAEFINVLLEVLFPKH